MSTRKEKHAKHAGIEMKLKLTVLTMMMLLCITNSSYSKAATYTTAKDVPEYGTYIIHSVKHKTTTGKTVKALNYSGYGEYAYCYGKITANLAGEYVTVSPTFQMYKGSGQYTYNLVNTVDAGKGICLKLTGAKTQVGTDTNKVSFTY